MARQSNRQKQKSVSANSGLGRRKWKIVAIAVFVIFVLLIIGGIIKIFHIKSSFEKPTQTQIDFASKIAAEKLKSSGINVSSFQMHTSTRAKRISNGGISRKVIQVAFYNSTANHVYLIDLSTGEVLLYSETDNYGNWIGNKMHDGDMDSMYPFMEHKR